MKSTSFALSVLAGLILSHGAAYATPPKPVTAPSTTTTAPKPVCAATDPTCTASTSAEVSLNTSYQLDPNHKGINVQVNTGDRISVIEMKNLVIQNNGNLSAVATSVGNNFSVNTTGTTAITGLKHISQSSKGDQVSVIDLTQSTKSLPGEVTLEAAAIGNNISLTGLGGTSLAELSIAQCNVGDGVAAIRFDRDPVKLSASATSVGNNVSISIK